VSQPLLLAIASAAGAVAVTFLNHLLEQIRRVLGEQPAVRVAEIGEAARIRTELRAEIQQLRDRVEKLQTELDSSRRAYRELLQQHGELELEHRQLKRQHDDLLGKYELVLRELEGLREQRS
jgi:chromosome segregation ATPase